MRSATEVPHCVPAIQGSAAGEHRRIPGATFRQAVTSRRQPAIPLNDADTPPGLQAPVPPVGPGQTQMQAIANAAGFHFAFIEQGGSSLYTIMALKASSLEALRIIVAIGGVETNHFSLWHDKPATPWHSRWRFFSDSSSRRMSPARSSTVLRHSPHSPPR
jgi:hypothetical protein